MKSSKMGLSGIAGGVMVLAMAIAPLGCEDSSSSSGGIQPEGGGVFNPDGGGGNDGSDIDPPVQSECVAPTKGPTMHGGGNASDPDETWTADGSPHILPFDTTIYNTVTIEPCAEVLIGDGKTVTVRNNGKLVAEGTATKRIHIGGKDAGKPFASIRSLGRTMRFAYTTIDGGGAQLNTAVYLAGMIDMQGDNQLPTQESLFVDHVTLAGSASNGLLLRDGAGFTQGSNALVVKASAAHPMSVFARSVGGIPVGSYTGNAIDQILLPTTSANETINETTTLHERGVPYLVGHATSDGSLRVDTTAGKPPVTLTIEPGVTMKFKKGGVLYVAVASSVNPARGSLIAVGTATKPIVFTSNEATPAAGDWLGLRFGDVPTATNKVDFVRVEYAGGSSVSGSSSCPDGSGVNNDAAIRFSGPPPSQFVTNTTIKDSLNHGFDRGWRADTQVDFLPTNSFMNVGRCTQTFPKDMNGACPPVGSVPCPK